MSEQVSVNPESVVGQQKDVFPGHYYDQDHDPLRDVTVPDWKAQDEPAPDEVEKAK